MKQIIAGFGFDTDVSAAIFTYVVAVSGSIAIELAALVRELANNDGMLPGRYRTVSYPVARILFAVVAAGPLAVMLSADTALTAFYIGISAPLIYDRAAAGIRLDSKVD